MLIAFLSFSEGNSWFLRNITTAHVGSACLSEQDLVPCVEERRVFKASVIVQK